MESLETFEISSPKERRVMLQTLKASADYQAPLRPWDTHNQTLLRHVHPPDWVNPDPASRYNLVVMGAALPVWSRLWVRRDWAPGWRSSESISTREG